jgi:hypothetical protein
VVAAMLFGASTALAGGVNLAWNTCMGDGGVNSRTFACGANTGSNVLTASFLLDADLNNVSGVELVLDILTTSDPVPDWWHFRDVGTCRQNSLTMNVVYADNLCLDWAGAQATGGIGSYSGDAGPGGWTIDPSALTRHRRLKIASAVPPSALASLLANQEYFSANISINNQKTVGTGACAGCSDPVCIVFNSIKVATPVPANDLTLGAPNTPGSNIVTWQAAVADCQLVPTRNTTWGAVKSMYR